MQEHLLCLFFHRERENELQPPPWQRFERREKVPHGRFFHLHLFDL